jgi:hypothetical protein
MRNTKKDLGDDYDLVVNDSVVVGTVVEEGDQKMSLSYIELPILLAIDMGEHLTLHVGPGFGFAMGSKLTQDFTQTSNNTLADTTIVTESDYELSGEDAKKALDQRTVEIALVLGAVYELESGLNFGLRYWRGLSSLQESTELLKTHANVFQLTLGWNFSDDRR